MLGARWVCRWSRNATAIRCRGRSRRPPRTKTLDGVARVRCSHGRVLSRAKQGVGHFLPQGVIFRGRLHLLAQVFVSLPGHVCLRHRRCSRWRQRAAAAQRRACAGVNPCAARLEHHGVYEMRKWKKNTLSVPFTLWHAFAAPRGLARQGAPAADHASSGQRTLHDTSSFRLGPAQTRA